VGWRLAERPNRHADNDLIDSLCLAGVTQASFGKSIRTVETHVLATTMMMGKLSPIRQFEVLAGSAPCLEESPTSRRRGSFQEIENPVSKPF
jgi:hypothetical protein